MIATTRDSTLVRELNQAGGQGFQLVRAGLMGDRYTVALLTEKEADERMRSASNDQYRLAALVLGRLGVFEKPVTP
ncbi:MAG TPA: hypothetical protein VKB50_12285 [Vicinamibacterales bacterium]|nr:hypothetical protein [Vicinamibacterales bacterium]